MEEFYTFTSLAHHARSSYICTFTTLIPKLKLKVIKLTYYVEKCNRESVVKIR